MMDFYQNNLVQIIVTLIAAFVITHRSIPTIVAVARKKSLYDEPNRRNSHTDNTPTLGGLAIFSGMFIAILTFININHFPDFQYVLAAVIVVFFTGLKDDILAISPGNKLKGQIGAAGIIIIIGNIRFTSLHGLFGVHEIPYFASVLLTLFIIIVIINCFNLIDGIDGLASGLALVASITFGTWFLLVQNYESAIIAAALAGALLAFFRYNVFGKKNKIIMGDTGALIIGLIMAVLAIKFNEMNLLMKNSTPLSVYYISSSPAVSFGILIVPLFDTLRVFVIRALRKRSPFKADKSHLHHRLLMLNFNHIQSTLILIAANILFIVMVVLLRNLGIFQLLSLTLLVAVIFSFIPLTILRFKLKHSKYSTKKKLLDSPNGIRFATKNYLKTYTKGKHKSKKKKENSSI